MRSEEVFHRVKEERNVVHTVKRREVNLIGHILCRNCLLRHGIERNKEVNMEVTGIQGRRCKQLLYDFKETRGY